MLPQVCYSHDHGTHTGCAANLWQLIQVFLDVAHSLGHAYAGTKAALTLMKTLSSMVVGT